MINWEAIGAIGQCVSAIISALVIAIALNRDKPRLKFISKKNENGHTEIFIVNNSFVPVIIINYGVYFAYSKINPNFRPIIDTNIRVEPKSISSLCILDPNDKYQSYYINMHGLFFVHDSEYKKYYMDLGIARISRFFFRIICQLDLLIPRKKRWMY